MIVDDLVQSHLPQNMVFLPKTFSNEIKKMEPRGWDACVITIILARWTRAAKCQNVSRTAL